MNLRETKKQETRRLISDCATQLFLGQGFDETTIAEIAEAARVAKKTVTNYFPRKEDLAFDQQDEFVGGLAEAVRARGPGESVLGALRRSFEIAVAARDPVAGFAGAPFSRMVAGSPTLSAALRGLHDLRERALARALEETTDQRGFTTRLAAMLLADVHRVLFQRIQELTLAGRSDDEIAEEVMSEATAAFDLLEPALGRFGVRAS